MQNMGMNILKAKSPAQSTNEFTLEAKRLAHGRCVVLLCGAWK